MVSMNTESENYAISNFLHSFKISQVTLKNFSKILLKWDQIWKVKARFLKRLMTTFWIVFECTFSAAYNCFSVHTYCRHRFISTIWTKLCASQFAAVIQPSLMAIALLCMLESSVAEKNPVLNPLPLSIIARWNKSEIWTFYEFWTIHYFLEY